MSSQNIYPNGIYIMPQNNLEIFSTTTAFRKWRSAQNLPIGFVPTMGNLHSGHLQLVQSSLKSYDIVVISIFVNPTQFGPSEDFARYPRTLNQDIDALEKNLAGLTNKKLVLFTPNSIHEIYEKNFSTQIKNLNWSNILEGALRPNHFDGVCTVVSILLNIVRPSALFLGKKDYQQLRILQQMIRDLCFDLEVIAIETVRNEQGLALSSRNTFLTNSELLQAANFPKHLQQTVKYLKEYWQQNKIWDTKHVTEILVKESSHTFKWDYLELREQSFSDLQPSSKELVLLGVVRLNSVRLLDNIEFTIN